MNRPFLIGLDLGTSIVKAAVYDADGTCLAYSAREATLGQPEPGVCLQSGEEFVRLALETIGRAVEKSGVDAESVAAIGFSGQMGGAIGIDADWQPVTEWSCPLDLRFQAAQERMIAEAIEQLVIESGTHVPYFGAKLLWWNHDFPELYNRTKKFIWLAAYVAGRLGDLKAQDAFVDPTYLECSALANLAQAQWSEGLCGRFEIDVEKLPRIISSSSVVGGLSRWAAEACGLQSGTPLVAGAGDKPAGSLGAGIVDPGLMIDESATFGALSLCVDRFVPDRKYRTLEIQPCAIPGWFHAVTFMIGSGTAHKWFRDTLGLIEQQEAAKANCPAFKILDDRAAAISPGSEGLMAIGMFNGRACPSDPDVRGLWIGISPNHTRAHFYRSMLESFAYDYAFGLRVMRELYPDTVIEAIHVVGGGAASDLWNQIKSDVLGLPYVRLGGADFSVRGAALLAGAGVGVIDDLRATARQLRVPLKRYEPNRKNHERYRPHAEAYERLFERLRPVFVDLKSLATPPENG